MIVLFEQPRIISPGPQYVAFEGLTTNLPLEGDQWLIIRSLYTNTVIEAGRCPPGTQNALINATEVAGKTVSAIAYGLGNTGTLFYANGVTIDPSVPLRLTAAVGPAPEFTPTRVAGKVQIDGTPAERTVRAFGYNATAHAIDGETVSQSKSLGQSTSDPTTGAYTIDLLAGYGSDVFVVAFDDYGDPFTPEQALTVGDRIHPTTPNGHVLECTGAGSLPAEEPEWIIDTETAQLYGSASMIARAFYRPMAHGPIAPEVTQTGISAKHWRIYMTELGNPDATYGGMIAELEFQDADGVRLDTAGGIATASSEYGSSYPAEDAFDQQSGTAWLTVSQATVPQWLAYEFSGPVTPKILGIQAGDNASRAARCPVSFLIEYSSDGVEWLVAGQVESAPAFAESEFRYYPF
jgi:hypothetical protein